MLVLEDRLGQPLEVALQERYDAGQSQRDIAEELGIDPGTVSRWMDRLGIEARYIGPRKTTAVA